MFAGQSAHAGAFGAHDNADGAFEIDLIDGLGGFICGADEPDTEFFELVHGTRKIRDPDDGDVHGAAARDAEDGFSDRGGFVFRDDDGSDASGIGGAEAGAEVVGVLDAVEDEHDGVGTILEERIEVGFVVEMDL